jgi:hypothetical protein
MFGIPRPDQFRSEVRDPKARYLMSLASICLCDSSERLDCSAGIIVQVPFKILSVAPSIVIDSVRISEENIVWHVTLGFLD